MNKIEQKKRVIDELLRLLILQFLSTLFLCEILIKKEVKI